MPPGVSDAVPIGVLPAGSVIIGSGVYIAVTLLVTAVTPVGEPPRLTVSCPLWFHWMLDVVKFTSVMT